MGGRSSSSKNTAGVSPSAGVPARSSGGVSAPGVVGPAPLPSVGGVYNNTTVAPSVVRGAGITNPALVQALSSPGQISVQTTGAIPASALVGAGLTQAQASALSSLYNSGVATFPSGAILGVSLTAIKNGQGVQTVVSTLGSMQGAPVGSVAPMQSAPPAPTPAPSAPPAVPIGQISDDGDDTTPLPAQVPQPSANSPVMGSLYSAPLFQALPGRIQEALASPYLPVQLQAIGKSRSPINVNTLSIDVTDPAGASQLAAGLKSAGLSQQQADDTVGAIASGQLSFGNGLQFQKYLGSIKASPDAATNQQVIAAFNQGAGVPPPVVYADTSKLGILQNGKNPITGIHGSFTPANLQAAGLSAAQAQTLSDRLNNGQVQFDSDNAIARYIARLSSNPSMDVDSSGLAPGPFSGLSNPVPMKSPTGDILMGFVNKGQTLGNGWLDASGHKLTAAELATAGVGAANAKSIMRAFNQQQSSFNADDLVSAINAGQGTSAASLKNFIDTLPPGPKAKNFSQNTGKNSLIASVSALSNRTNQVPRNYSSSDFSSLQSLPASVVLRIQNALKSGQIPTNSAADIPAIAKAVTNAPNYGISQDHAVSILANGGTLNASGVPAFDQSKVQVSNQTTVPSNKVKKVIPKKMMGIAQANTPRPGNISAPKMNATSPDDFDAIHKIANDFQNGSSIGRSGYHVSGYVAGVLAHQGFDALPSVVSKQEMDKLITGGAIQMFRSVNDSGGVTGRQLLHGLRYGVNRVGRGVYGHGTYAAYGDPNNALGASAAYGRNTVRMALKPGAKVADINSLRNEFYADQRAYRATGRSLPDILSDPNDDTALASYAAAKGYDAINIPGGGSNGAKYINILNRSALAMEDTDWR